MKKFRCLPSELPQLELSEVGNDVLTVESKLISLQSKIKFFHAFVGALWAYRGPQYLLDWVEELLQSRRSDLRLRHVEPLSSDDDDSVSDNSGPPRGRKRPRLELEVSSLFVRSVVLTMLKLIKETRIAGRTITFGPISRSR